MKILGIDPGRHTGFAVIEHGILIACGLGDPRPNLHAQVFDVVFIECPQIYPRSPVPPNDLIKLAVNVGEYKSHFEYYSPVKLVLPHEWKGTTPKDVTKRRMLAAYTNLPDYLKGLPESLKNNAVDAVGIAHYGYACTKARTK